MPAWLVQAQEAEAKKRKRPKAPVGLGQLAAKKKKGTKGVSGLIDKWQAVRKDLVCRVLFRCCIHYLLAKHCYTFWPVNISVSTIFWRDQPTEVLAVVHKQPCLQQAKSTASQVYPSPHCHFISAAQAIQQLRRANIWSSRALTLSVNM